MPDCRGDYVALGERVGRLVGRAYVACKTHHAAPGDDPITVVQPIVSEVVSEPPGGQAEDDGAEGNVDLRCVATKSSVAHAVRFDFSAPDSQHPTKLSVKDQTVRHVIAGSLATPTDSRVNVAIDPPEVTGKTSVTVNLDHGGVEPPVGLYWGPLAGYDIIGTKISADVAVLIYVDGVTPTP